MPAEDPKRSALISEGMTEGEADFMLSGGRKAEGLTPPDDAPTEPAAPVAVDPVKAPDPAATAPVDPPDEEPEPAKDSAYYPQWKREKGRRQELQRELKARDEAITSERATTQAEREKWARLDERLRVFQQAVEQPAQPVQPTAPPDPETDPFAYMRWLGEQVTGLAGKTDQVATNVQERDAATELQTTYLRDAREFASKQADFGQAYNWLMANRDAELAAAGYTDPAERMRIIALDERDIVARALTARQANPNASGPAQIIYGLAKARGFTLPAQPPNGGASNGTAPAAIPTAPAAPAAPSVTAQVEAIQRGAAASRSLSSAGGSPPPQGIDLGKLMEMDDNEYQAWKASLSPAQSKELRMMLGASR